MKRVFRVLSYVGVFAVGLIAGYVGGLWNPYMQLWDQVAHTDSAALQMRVSVLSHLRLGEVDEAIRLLEVPLDNEALMIAFGESKTLSLASVTMRPENLRSLQLAKVYRAMYPSAVGTTEPPIGDVLTQVPDMSFPVDCDGALCRLAKGRPASK